MITYFDTSVLVKLLVDDESGAEVADRLWTTSDRIVCAEIGYVEARAALAAVHRSGRLSRRGLASAKAELDTLWAQVWVVTVTTEIVMAAAELAESEGLRGYDAVHLAAAVATGVDVVVASDGKLLEAAARRHFAVADPNLPIG